MKICKICNTEKPLGEYYAKRNECKVCCRERARLANLSDPEKRREIYRKSSLKKYYNLTPEQFSELAKDGCEVCGTREDLCVDHNHNCCPGKFSCGECVRGVLCSRHNKAEGLLRGNPDEAMALAAYMIRVGESVKV